ncbi:Uncharacterized protein Adt_40984 [Abeliophyllum distichum]|uniref:Uncharacterized protein n=1 Tax=Abeliophyllum distichum TaxID=126358 RepID=A0ABD1PMJ9_9LAMI
MVNRGETGLNYENVTQGRVSRRDVNASSRKLKNFNPRPALQLPVAILVFSPTKSPYTHDNISMIAAAGGCSAPKTAVRRGSDGGDVGEAIPTTSLMILLENIKAEESSNADELVKWNKTVKGSER